MTSTRREALAELPQLGGRLCLDFVNTIDPREGPRARDFLGDYVDLALWAAAAGATDETIRAQLVEVAANDPTGAAAVFARAIGLRETLYRILRAEASAASPRQEDLATLQAELHEALGHLVLVADGGYRWRWDDDRRLDRPLWPILRDAAELLTTPELERVRLCPGRECGWLFLDRTKNRSRRWCTMATCGSRDKMRRLHARRRASGR
jgi:predicted RNA-binding Zn ribbon-like protein